MEINNRRIAKNAFLMYMRMFILMPISLYTSRVILNTLGVEDFGIYNVVGGVIAMLGFLNASLSGASSRFITFNIGIGDHKKLKRTFGNILSIHALLALIILLLGETICLWFVYTQLQIPQPRFDAAIWVYHFSVISAILSILTVPYNSTIIAHEHMSAFAYLGIFDGIARLAIALMVNVSTYDKLILYALLLLLLQIFDFIVYTVYSTLHFEETKSRPVLDKTEFYSLFKFAGWVMTGNLAVIGSTHGFNILLNLFFGPAVNAARGIAVQLQNVVKNFCYNFQIALNPQITKSYAQEDYQNLSVLIIRSSRFSFFLMLFLSLPIILEAPILLKWWLNVVPDYTVQFLRWTLCSTIIYALANPIVHTINSSGNLKTFQIAESLVLSLVLPLSYIALKVYNCPPVIPFVIYFIIELLTQIVRLIIVLPVAKITMKTYLEEVIIPIFFVLLFSLPLPIFASMIISNQYINFFTVSALSIFSVGICTLYMGCNKGERAFVLNVIKEKIKR